MEILLNEFFWLAEKPLSELDFKQVTQIYPFVRTYLY